jgi:hypothetical protein
MSGAKSKPKTDISSVSKSKSTDPTPTPKSNSGGASSSKSHPVQNVNTSSTATKPSKFYMACRNNEIDTVISMLPTVTLEEINQIEPNGSTALHAAAYYGNQEIVELLLSKGAARMIKNKDNSTPYEEAKTEEIKKLFDRSERTERKSKGRFTGEKGPSFEWIFVKGDPSSYASFNRESLLKCRSDEEFDRLCRGIRRYYINENGPLADVEDIKLVRSFFDKAIKNNDPMEVVRAYTAETGFYNRLNQDLSQLPTHWSGIKHERNIASIMIFHPVFQNFSFTGETYRGMNISLEDLNEYVVDSVFMNKTFLSTSKAKTRAESFAAQKKSSKGFKVICKYLIKHAGTAIAVENMSEFSFEQEVIILPYASFKVKRIQKNPMGKGGEITEIDVEEDEQVKWTLKNSYQSSQTHTSVKNKTTKKEDDDDNDSYAKMFKDSQEKGIFDLDDLAKWRKEEFGIDSSTDTFAKMRNDAKKGKLSKNDLANWKKESGVVTKGDNYDDEENDSNIFTASNEQSYATSKKFTSKEPFDMKEFMTQFENDSDD